MNNADWNSIHATVTDLAPRAKRLYLGRTYFPELRLLQHRRDKGLNKLFALYWSDERSEIAATEERVLAEFGHLARLENVVADSRGAWHPARNCIYLSWTWIGNGGNQRVQGRLPLDVVQLPTQASHNRYLRTPLSLEEAAEVLRGR